VRIARGTYSNLNSSVSDLQEGEIVYATDQDKLYVKEGAALVSTQAVVDPDTAVTDVDQTFTAGQRGEITTVTSSSGVVTIDFGSSNNFFIELSENVTGVGFTNSGTGSIDGQSGSIFIKQPTTGGPYTVGGWNAAFLFSGGTAPTITATNGKCDRIDYVARSTTEIHLVWSGNY
jgi:hypothetical protein